MKKRSILSLAVLALAMIAISAIPVFSADESASPSGFAGTFWALVPPVIAIGLALITIRNGNVHNPKYTKCYAEKIMMCDEGQVSPMHFHWNKMEDIINRGGNEIHFKLYNATKDEQLADTDVEICKDGRRYYVKAGETIVLRPGESLSLYPYYYHEFIIPKNGKGPALIGEVSMCNDDNTDNRFLKPLGRFPTIEEDEPAYRLLCTEYPAAKD